MLSGCCHFRVRNDPGSTMSAKKWILTKHFEGMPKKDDLQLVEEEIPNLGDGDVLFEAVYLSVDPYMRPFSSQLPLMSVMIGQQLARVKESKNNAYKKDSLYLGNFGWRSHTVVNPDKTSHAIKKMPDIGDLPKSLTLGTIGMPGVTAHVGLLEVGKMKPGEVVLVNAAAGAVGHVVGQIAKIKGCKVIGFAGSDAKLAWLKELGFDFAFNYKTANITDSIKKVAPNGVDVFYDNVGGTFGLGVIQHNMAKNGRVVVIGSISVYNASTESTGPNPLMSILLNTLKVEGLLIYDWNEKYWENAFADIVGWIKEGKLKYRETITDGFDNMREAFYGLFSGENIGKAVVKV